MVRKILLASSSLLLLAGGAFAADLPTEAPAPAPYIAPAPVFTWTGFYAGVNAGAAWNNNRTTYDYATAAGAPFLGVFPTIADSEGDGVTPTTLGSDSSTGFIGGGQIGFNWQNGAIVWGLEADIDGLSNGRRNASFVGSTPVGAANPYSDAGSANASLDFLGTARLRVGLAFNRTLIYATGGLAYGQARSSTSAYGAPVAPAGLAAAAADETDNYYGSSSKMRVGYAVGGGVEYAFTNNWTAKIEGLYYDLGKSSYGVPQNATDSTQEGLAITAHNHYQGELVRVGLNYKF